ncbi:MAG: DNA polymerase III subunit beta [Fusobacteriaceae bacterium]|jgi:DNA polymerase-3 subunit beta|nr:DNA polymerase III subunit beta [Fusobacteriaceae bacterium]
MKIVVNRKEFINVLTNMSNIVKETPVRPVLSGTRLLANEFGIEFAGTTLETSLKNRLEGRVIEEGTVVFKIPLILEYVKLIDVEEIEVKVEGNTLYIHNAEFSVFDADDYPRLNEVNGNIHCEIDIMDLLDGFEKVKFSASNHTDNLALSVIRLESYDGKLHFVSSDSYRLSYFNSEVNVLEDFEISIPLEAVNALIKIFKSYEGRLSLSIEGNQLKIETKDIIFTTRLIELAFPPYKGILAAQQEDKEIELNKEQFISALKKVYTVAKTNQETKEAAIFNFSGNKLNIQASAGRAKTSQNIDTLKTGDDVKASLNVKFLLDFAHNLKNNVIIKASTSSSKFVISEYKNDSYTYILMPLALREV